MTLMRHLRNHLDAWPIVCLFLFFLAAVLISTVPDRPQTTETGKRVYYRAFINQGIAAKQEGYYKEAIEALQFVALTHTKGFPEWQLATSQLAITYELTGNQKLADHYYLMSAKYSPDAVSMRKSAQFYRYRRLQQEKTDAQD